MWVFLLYFVCVCVCVRVRVCVCVCVCVLLVAQLDSQVMQDVRFGVSLNQCIIYVASTDVRNNGRRSRNRYQLTYACTKVRTL